MIPYWIDGLTATTSRRHGRQPDLDRAAVPQQRLQVAHRRRGRRQPDDQLHPQAGRPRADHAVDPQPDRVLRRPGAARRPGPGDPRSAGRRRRRSRRSPTSSAPTSRWSPSTGRGSATSSRAISATSYQYQAPIGPLLTTALGNSLKLAAVAFVIVVPLGIIGGVVAALNVGKPIDRIISVVGLSATVIPEFVSGIVLILVFAIGLNVLPMSASGGHGFGGTIYHLIMPAIPLTLILFGYIQQMARAGTVEALDLRLRAHGHPQGPAARGDDPPPRPAQLAAADDHRDRHPDRLPDRRPGARRDLFRYNGIGSLVYNAANKQGLPDARGRRAGDRRSSTWWRR